MVRTCCCVGQIAALVVTLNARTRTFLHRPLGFDQVVLENRLPVFTSQLAGEKIGQCLFVGSEMLVNVLEPIGRIPLSCLESYQRFFDNRHGRIEQRRPTFHIEVSRPVTAKFDPRLNLALRHLFRKVNPQIVRCGGLPPGLPSPQPLI